MKNKKWIFAIISIVIALFITSCTAFDERALDDFFDKIPPERDVDVIGVYDCKLYKNGEETIFDMFAFLKERSNIEGKSYEDYYFDRFVDYLVCYNDCVYFLMRSNFTEYGTSNLQIWSLNLKTDTGDLRKFDIGEFGTRDSDLKAPENQYYHQYEKMFQGTKGEYYNFVPGKIEYAYRSGNIYVKDLEHIIRFDLADSQKYDCDENAISFFVNPYNIVKSGEEYAIIDSNTGESQALDFDNLIKSACGGKLGELASKKTWDKKSYLEKLDSFVWGYLDGNLYFSFTVLDYNGDTIPVTFNYDFCKNKFFYLFAGHRGDTIYATESHLIPYIAQVCA